MSTILDSLKKSSEKRNSSGGDSLDNFNFSDGKKPSRSFSKIIIALFIMLVFVAAFWVYQNYFAINETELSPEPVSNQQMIKATRSTAETFKISQATKKEKPNSDIIKAQIKQLKEQKEIEERQAKLADLNQKNASSVKNNKSDEEITQANKSRRSLVKTDKYKMDEGKLETQETAKQKPVQDTSKQEEVAQRFAMPTQQYRLLYQLPFAIRKEIPELKLNIHVYDEQPVNRIAIINGTRFAIEDMIDDQVQLKDILVDGVLLDFNGNEFFISN